MQPPAENPATQKLDDPAALRGNLQVLQYVQAFYFIVAGLAVGIVGLEGWMGLLAFACLAALLTGVLTVACKGNTEMFFLQSSLGLFASSMWGQSTAFLLFWALGYSVVHVF
jgi:hypothetical protein